MRFRGILNGCIMVTAILCTGCTNEYDDKEIRENLADLEQRVKTLEELCNKMNTNISSLQTLVNAMQNNDYITRVTPITEGEQTIGYTIEFLKSAPITIYNGKNGEKGDDGHTPIIGVRQDTDDILYWTLDGEWLLDNNNQKIKAQGSDGQPGASGDTGVTPHLKIENGYWYISYDNEVTWKQLGKATGDKGEQGEQGNKGEDGHSPVIGVRQDTNGIYYWTLDGEWLLDNNNQKIKAQGTDGQPGTSGNPGITPHLKIENGYWYISYDNENTWQQLGKATGDKGEQGEKGDSMFESVTENENFVYITLPGNDPITISKYKPLSITFNETEDIRVLPGQTYNISYTLIGTFKEAKVRAVAQDGYHVEVKPKDAISGTITITTPESTINSSVLVFVSDETGSTTIASINFITGIIEITTQSYTVYSDGGQINVEVSSNIEYSVEIPKEAQSWIHYIPEQARAVMREDILTFIIDPNPDSPLRQATIQLVNKQHNITKSVLIIQTDDQVQNVHVSIPGTLQEQLQQENIPFINKLKITGSLNKQDYEFIRTQLVSLKLLDLSELNDTEIPERAFESSNIEIVKLPQRLTIIPSCAFYKSWITTIDIPQTVKIIKDYAFYETKNLRGNIIIPDEVETIEYEAFGKSLFNGTLTIGKKVKNIADNAFYQCSQVKGDLIIPDNVTSLGRNTFGHCGFTGSIVIGEGITIIPESAFSLCRNFSGSLIIGNNVEIIGNDAFNYCENLTGDLIIPDKVTKIGESAFWGNRGFTNLTIGKNIEFIDAKAFDNTRFGSISNKIYCKKQIPPHIIGDSFGKEKPLEYLGVPIGAKEKYQQAEVWKDFSQIEEIVF